MATTLNKVTVGNDFVLKIKVGLVQYGNNTVSWDYMDLTTCRNIVFNISCTKHNIDINLPFTIDSEDHSVISAIVRAELLHANSIYNFTISGLDSNGYRWTYISPKQQSFLTTAVTEETSAAAYTELAFTAGMIMPLAAQGKDGHTPYIGQNNNWWINGVDTGISAIVIPDMSNFYTKTEGISNVRYQLDEIYRDRDCTDDLNKILSHDTVSIGSDIHTLWEIVFNAAHHQNLGGTYKEQPIKTSLTTDDQTGISTTAYTFFDPDTNKKYTVEVDWTLGNEYYGPVLGTRFSSEDFYNKTETDAAISYAIENIDIPVVDLTSYATKDYVDNAINNIDIPEGSGNTINYIKSNIYDFNGEFFYYLDEYGNISSRIDNFTRHFLFDTGVELTNDTEIEIICSNSIGLPGVWYDWSYSVLGVYDPSTDKRVLMLAEEGGDNDIHMQITNNGMSVIYSLYPDHNKKLDSIHTYKISNSSGWIDGKNIISYDGQDISVLPNPVDWEDWMYNEGLSNMTIKCLPSTGNYYIYGLKIWKSGTLIRDYVPVKTDNGDGFHDNVSNTDIVSPEMKFETRCLDTYSTDAVQSITSSINNNSQGYTETRVNQQSPVDCTGTINDILADTAPTTNITRWDQVIPLWEVSHNEDYRYHGRGRYYDCDIDAYLDKDENTQHNIATYRFWHPIEKRYYTITISYDYNDERGNLISCTYEVSDYATKTYVDSAIANIPSGTTPDLSNYVTNSSLSTTLNDYVTNSSLSTTLNDYVTNSSLSTTLADYVTDTDLSTELNNYVTSSDLQNNILSDYITGTSLSTTLADYVTSRTLSTELSNYATATDLSAKADIQYVNGVSDNIYTNIDENTNWGPFPVTGVTCYVYGEVKRLKIYTAMFIPQAGQGLTIGNKFVIDISNTWPDNGYVSGSVRDGQYELPSQFTTEQITVLIKYNLEQRSGSGPLIYDSVYNETIVTNSNDKIFNDIMVEHGQDMLGDYVILNLSSSNYFFVNVYSAEINNTSDYSGSGMSLTATLSDMGKYFIQAYYDNANSEIIDKLNTLYPATLNFTQNTTT